MSYYDAIYLYVYMQVAPAGQSFLKQSTGRLHFIADRVLEPWPRSLAPEMYTIHMHISFFDIYINVYNNT